MEGKEEGLDTPAAVPAPVTLKGTYVTLVPLHPDTHTDPLYECIGGPANAGLWTWMFDLPPTTPEQLRVMLARKAALSPFEVYMVIIDNSTGVPEGYLSYMRAAPEHRSIEIGHVMFSKRMQKTRKSTETVFLMIAHAIEELRYRRIEWKCNDLNEPSKAAAQRYGFSYEGLFRCHMIINGKSRDSAWFSLIDHEWPALKSKYIKWLSEDNFDSAGQQKQRLGDM